MKLSLSLVLASCAFQTSSQSADSAFFDASTFSFYVQFSVNGIVSYLLSLCNQISRIILQLTYLLYLFSFTKFYDSLNFRYLRSHSQTILGQFLMILWQFVNSQTHLELTFKMSWGDLKTLLKTKCDIPLKCLKTIDSFPKTRKNPLNYL